jgi:hypothetical protein
MNAVRKPSVLFVHDTFTKQALRVTEDMESVFRAHRWDITRAQIELTDGHDAACAFAGRIVDRLGLSCSPGASA